MPPRTRVQRTGGIPKETQSPKADAPEPVDEVKKDRRVQSLTEVMDMALLPLAARASMEQMQLEANAKEGEHPLSVLALDLHVIHSVKEPYAQAVVDLAEHYPVVGVLLDKLGKSGPIMTLVGLTITVAAQIAENHEKLPAQMRKSLGVIPRQDVATSILAEADQRKSANGNGN